jgi:hypothetical protein
VEVHGAPVRKNDFGGPAPGEDCGLSEPLFLRPGPMPVPSRAAPSPLTPQAMENAWANWPLP